MTPRAAGARAGLASRFGGFVSECCHPLLWLVLVVALAARVTFGPHVTDDAFITFRYAEHLAEFKGFTYNPPARVLGATSPLMVLLLAASQLAGVGLTYASFAIAVTGDLATIAATAVLLDRAGFRVAGVLAGAALALWPGYVTWSVSGMETSLYVALVTMAFHALAGGRPARAGMWTGLAGLARPDGALVAVTMGAWFLWRSRQEAARYVSITALIVLPWLLFATGYFGSPIPASIAAKAATTRLPGASLRNFADYFLHGRYIWLSGMALIGAAMLLARAPVWMRVWHAWWLLYVTAFLAANAFVDYLWYFVPLLPLYIACACVAGDGGARWARQRFRLARLPVSVGATAVVAVMLVIGSWRLAWHLSDVSQWSAGRERLYEEVAIKLTREARGAPCILAATEIGTLGFNYPGPILDLVGLVSPEVVGRDRGVVLRDSGARWLVTYDDHFDRRIARDPGFSSSFRLIHRIPVGPARALEVYERTPRPCG